MKKFILLLLFAVLLECHAAVKCISAPYFNENITIDGKLDEKVWAQAQMFNDFLLYKKLTPVPKDTEVYVYHNEKYLFFGIKCHTKRADTRPVNDHGGNIWNGDCFELFLGDMRNEPFVYQYCISSGDAVYGANKFYKSKSSIADDFWSAEIQIDLDFLPFHNGSIGMHIARLIGKSRKYVVFSDSGSSFRNVMNYSRLYLGSYNRAAELEFRCYTDKKLSRKDFEKLYRERSILPEKIVYGPYLFGASETEMNIGWYNHGRTGSIFEYRKKGEKDFKSVMTCATNGKLNLDKRLHKVQLKNLEKNSIYEYRIKNFHDPKGKFTVFPDDGNLYTFATHGKKDLTFAVLSDVHSAGYAMENLLKHPNIMQKCDLLVNIGDMVSSGVGVLSVMHGYLDSQICFAQKKPILNFSGNHEYYDFSPGAFFDVFGTPDFNGCSLNRFGDVCLIGLDPYTPNQRQWLEQAIKSPYFQTAKHRILLVHFPPARKGSEHANALMQIIDGIFSGEKPQAKIDLMIAGHLHIGGFIAPDSGIFTPIDSKRKPFPAEKLPFAVYINEGMRKNYQNCLSIVQTKGDSIILKLVGIDGSITGEFTIKK